MSDEYLKCWRSLTFKIKMQWENWWGFDECHIFSIFIYILHVNYFEYIAIAKLKSKLIKTWLA